MQNTCLLIQSRPKNNWANFNFTLDQVGSDRVFNQLDANLLLNNKLQHKLMMSRRPSESNRMSGNQKLDRIPISDPIRSNPVKRKLASRNNVLFQETFAQIAYVINYSKRYDYLKCLCLLHWRYHIGIWNLMLVFSHRNYGCKVIVKWVKLREKVPVITSHV